jgi:cell wall-associated NlpC family hydrolase
MAPAAPGLATIGITIQAGAFANLDNAVGLTETLQAKGLEATFFKDDDGLFKVRFGDFATREEARRHALALQRDGVLEVFYIVVPAQLAAGQRERRGDAFVRAQIVRTAESFIGLPYRWGGTSAEDGFDCSGLTMTAYRLNGYRLPRTSRDQYAVGAPIDTNAMQPADLVFFRTSPRRKVSHVGLYIGDGCFIHAPGRGKQIRIDSLDGGYYRRRLVGARHFL